MLFCDDWLIRNLKTTVGDLVKIWPKKYDWNLDEFTFVV